jgi:hypothetical protein
MLSCAMPVISSIPAPFRAAQGSAPENASHLQGTLFEEVARFLRQLASHFHVLPQLASLVRIQLLRMPVHVARSLEARHLVQAVHHVALRWLRELPRLVRRHSGPLCAAVSANAGSLTLTGHVPLACAYIGRAPLLRTRARSVSRSRGRPRARRPTALAVVPGSPNDGGACPMAYARPLLSICCQVPPSAHSAFVGLQLFLAPPRGIFGPKPTSLDSRFGGWKGLPEGAVFMWATFYRA